MKTLLSTIVIATVTTACSSLPEKSAYLPVQGNACIEQRPQINGHASNVRWCIVSRMFQPRDYVVTLNKEIMFSGTDYERVKFSKNILAGKVTGHCDEYVTLIDNATDRPTPTASLPAHMVEACAIGTNQGGASTMFLKSEVCDIPFYENMRSLLGKMTPVENQRRCTVELDGRLIFDGLFTTARRF